MDGSAGAPDSWARDAIDLRISGMHCAGCVQRVERALGAVPGVASASVNLATEQARVLLGAAAPPAAQLLEAVRRAGYAAELPDVPPPAPPPRWRADGAAAGLALLLALPLLVPMLAMPLGETARLPPWLALLLASVLQFVFGARFYAGAWRALLAGAADMDTLVALGTSAAYGLGVWGLATGAPVPGFESAGVVIALVRLGKWMEARARREAGAAIRALAELRPEQARIRRDGADHTVSTASLRLGDRLVIRPGERIAADCVLREGEGSVDESLLTGESLPVAKAPGDRLVGGAVNGEALLLADVTAVGAEGRLARMVRLVEAAQADKPPIQRLVDRVAAVFVPAVLGLAAATFAGWWLAGAPVAGMVAGVSVLVVACPCALGLATPAAIAVGTGVAARHGILIRDAAALESARTIRTVVFDKTGTLTEGRPALVALRPVPGVTEAALLADAAALQAGSEHPLARAVRQRAEGSAPRDARAVHARPGRGVEGVVAGRRLLLGNARLMAEAGVDTAALAAAAEVLAGEGRTVSFLAEPGRLLGLLGFGDAIRAGAGEAVAALQARGLGTALLTGDGVAAARSVARRLGIAQVRAEALPEDKLALVAELRAEGGVAMVGDGLNDAAALAAADLSIAMAGGTDAAAAAAGITLMRPDPMLVPAALDIARRTEARIRHGLFWACVYNAIAIPLAACGVLSPAVAGAAMALSSVSVVGNALLLRRWRPARSRLV